MSNYIEDMLWREAQKLNAYKAGTNTRERWKEYHKLTVYVDKETLYGR